jgi:hypothetical protein
MKALEPGMILRFPKKPEYIDGKITVDVYRPRKFFRFRWMSRFKKEVMSVSILRHG